MSNVLQQLQAMSAGILKSVIAAAPASDGTFRMTVTVQLGNAVKPLLIMGKAHRQYDDGRCLAILNPDKGLLSEFSPEVGYEPITVKELVAGRCDAMIYFWLVGDRVDTMGSYRARHRRPATFVVA